MRVLGSVGCQSSFFTTECCKRTAQHRVCERSQIQTAVGILSSLVARYDPSMLKATIEAPIFGNGSSAEGVAAGGVIGWDAREYVGRPRGMKASCQISVFAGFKVLEW